MSRKISQFYTNSPFCRKKVLFGNKKSHAISISTLFRNVNKMTRTPIFSSKKSLTPLAGAATRRVPAGGVVLFETFKAGVAWQGRILAFTGAALTLGYTLQKQKKEMCCLTLGAAKKSTGCSAAPWWWVNRPIHLNAIDEFSILRPKYFDW